MDTQAPIGWLTDEEIERPLRRMTIQEVGIADEWTVQQLTGGRGDDLGVWRISGMMTTPTGEQQWSMVLKGWDSTGEPGSPAAYNWPRREAELYRSGVLYELSGVHSPACFGSVERRGSVWVWLEDLTGTVQPKWTMEHYATAAKLLGRFNGSYLSGRPLPVQRGLSRQWLAGWTRAATGTMSALNDHRQHPFVEGMLPPDVSAAYFRIWDRRQAILDALDAMPQTFCHLDAFHRNIFFRGKEGNDEMALIDWSFAGIAAVGEELAALCGARTRDARTAR